MSATGLAAILALGAAASFALSSAVKHLSAAHAPDPLTGGLVRGIGHLASYTLRHPLWLLGTAIDVVGFGLHVLALHLGGLVLVQPLLVTAVAGSLVLRRHLAGDRQDRRELVLALLLVTGLTLFEVSIDPRHAANSPADRLPAYLFGVVGLLLIATAAAVAIIRRGGRIATALLGGSGGLLYAAAAALITLVSAQVVHDGFLAPLHRDEIYVLVAVGIAAEILNQTAFQAGAIAISAPSSASADLIASVGLGIVVFDQPLPHTPLPILGVAVGALTVLVTVVALAHGVPREATDPDASHR